MTVIHQPQSTEQSAPLEYSGLSPLLDNTNVKAFEGLTTPNVLIQSICLSEKSNECVSDSRNAISQILSGEDKRLVIVVGPCSVHDFKSAIEYARRLKALREQLKDSLEIVMRVYFEKPRTTVGWKGFINDPDLNGTNNVNKGLLLGRLLLSEITNLGVPTACEFLESYTPQYIGDFVSYAAIGARTTPCPLHQKLASGLSMPVGIKNLTDGDIEGAAAACKVAVGPTSFLGITRNGMPAYLQTSGNPDAHVILRGGSNGPNYTIDYITATFGMMEEKGLRRSVVVDTSHANSQKKHKNQLAVIDDIIATLESGKADGLHGLMIESHLNEGNQNLDHAIAKVVGQDETMNPESRESILKSIYEQDCSVLNELAYGVSITDACISWDDTEAALIKLAAAVKRTRFA